MSHRVAAAVAACAAVVLFAHPARAQELELPRPSPAARVDQRVGLTDFQLEYSSPGVKSRPIWGALVPYGKMWRTGANAATRLTVSRDFQLGNKKVKAGTYSLFTIPGKTSWTVVLNSDKGASTDEYKQAKDVARIVVKPATMAEPRERLTFLFSGTTDDAASLDLEWERMRVRIPIKVDTKTQVMAGIDRAVDNAWATHADAAEYLLETERQPRPRADSRRSVDRHRANLGQPLGQGADPGQEGQEGRGHRGRPAGADAGQERQVLPDHVQAAG